MINRFIRCILCNQVVPSPQYFGDFGEIPLLPGVVWSDEDLACRKEFDLSHGNHPQEDLEADPESFFSEKPVYEPNRISYFEATNGRQRFLIKRTKPGFAHPAHYEILPGKMLISNTSIKVQDEEVRKQIFADIGPAFLSQEKVQKFMTALTKEAGRILPQNLPRGVDAMMGGDPSLLAYAALTEACWEKILQKCAQDFEPGEVNRIRDFIQEHRQPGEVLSLLVHRMLVVLPQEDLTLSNP